MHEFGTWIDLATERDVIAFGHAMAQSRNAAAPGAVIALCGPMGAGKTHLAKGFVTGVGSEDEVASPTFGLVHEYRSGRVPVFHFDFYRLDSAHEALGYGWDDYVEGDGVCLVEWADRFPDLMPPHTEWWEIDYAPTGGRRVRRLRTCPDGAR